MSRATRKTTVLLRALLASSLVIGLARAEVINWTSDASGIWNLGANWDGLVAPGPNDDAKHLKMLNHIEVAGDRSCLSFEGTSGKGDRFLRIDSGNKLTVGIGGLFKSIGAGTPIANFPVRMQNGAFNNRTTANVAGVIDGIDFGPARKHQANDVQLLFSGAMRDSSILFGDSASIFAFGLGDIASTSLTVGDDATLLLDNRSITGPGNHTVAWNIGEAWPARSESVTGLVQEMNGCKTNSAGGVCLVIPVCGAAL